MNEEKVQILPLTHPHPMSVAADIGLPHQRWPRGPGQAESCFQGMRGECVEGNSNEFSQCKSHPNRSSPKFGYFPPSTTSGALAVLHNSDTILFPSSAIVPPLPLASMPSPPPHQPGPPFPPSPDSSSIYFSYLSTLFTLFPFQLVSFSSTSCPGSHSVSISLLPSFTQIHNRGQGFMVIKPNPCLSHKWHQVQTERQLFPLRLLRKTGSRAQPVLSQSQPSSHTVAAFQAGRHHTDQGQPPHLR